MPACSVALTLDEQALQTISSSCNPVELVRVLMSEPMPRAGSLDPGLLVSVRCEGGLRWQMSWAVQDMQWQHCTHDTLLFSALIPLVHDSCTACEPVLHDAPSYQPQNFGCFSWSQFLELNDAALDLIRALQVAPNSLSQIVWGLQPGLKFKTKSLNSQKNVFRF